MLPLEYKIRHTCLRERRVGLMVLLGIEALAVEAAAEKDGKYDVQ
jgi:hypothetical protein